jgi:hypothetical protein
MSEIHGVRSFEGLRNRAKKLNIGPFTIIAASLADIIKSKKAAGRVQDLAVLPVLESALAEAGNNAETTPGGTQERE